MTSIENLPNLPKLTRLELTDNQMTLALDPVTKYTNLEALKLGGNKYATLESLNPLKSLTKLENLDLSLNPIAEIEDYRSKLFEFIPSLKILDGTDKEGNEYSSESDDEAESEECEEEKDEDFIEDDKLSEGEVAKLKEAGYDTLPVGEEQKHEEPVEATPGKDAAVTEASPE